MGSSAVTEQLREDIISGALLPGERLVELQLADRYSAGRATIRAALVELRSEGLVQIEANRGATVRRVPLEEAVEIVEARGVLEALLAGKAAINGAAEERDRLGVIVGDMAAAVAAEDAPRYSELNLEFHRLVHRMGRHHVAAELVGVLRNRAVHHQYRLAGMPGRSAVSLPQHRDIAEAIRAGDEDAARKAMAAHLASVAAVLRQWVEAGPRA